MSTHQKKLQPKKINFPAKYTPGVIPQEDPEEPMLPAEPDLIPDENPFETPSPFESPSPGEGP